MQQIPRAKFHNSFFIAPPACVASVVESVPGTHESALRFFLLTMLYYTYIVYRVTACAYKISMSSENVQWNMVDDTDELDNRAMVSKNKGVCHAVSTARKKRHSSRIDPHYC